MAVVTINRAPCNAEPGTLLSDVVSPHIHLETPCGRLGRCGKCRVAEKQAYSSQNHYIPKKIH